MTFSAGISFLPRISKKPALKQTGLAAVLFVDTRFLRHKGGTILSYKQHWNDSPQETLCGPSMFLWKLCARTACRELCSKLVRPSSCSFHSNSFSRTLPKSNAHEWRIACLHRTAIRTTNLVAPCRASLRLSALLFIGLICQ